MKHQKNPLWCNDSIRNSSLLGFRLNRNGGTIIMEELKKKCNDVLKDIETLMKHLEEYKDNGWVLDFCDSLNKLSVTY